MALIEVTMKSNNASSNICDDMRLASNIVSNIFNGDSNYVRKVNNDDMTYYITHDVAKMLHITNITDAMSSLYHNKKTGDSIVLKHLINNNNCCRKMYVLSAAGVIQMMLNGNTEVCKMIKAYISSQVLVNYYS